MLTLVTFTAAIFHPGDSTVFFAQASTAVLPVQHQDQRSLPFQTDSVQHHALTRGNARRCFSLNIQ